MTTLSNSTPAWIRFNNYDGVNIYINGLVKIVAMDIMLSDAVIHIIDKVLTPPCPASLAVNCTVGLPVDLSIVDDLANDPLLVRFKAIIDMGPYSFPTPSYTLFAFQDLVFDFNFDANLESYLALNSTARKEWLDRVIIPGTYFPVAGLAGGVNVTTVNDTEVYLLVDVPPGQRITLAGALPLAYSLPFKHRFDGVYYAFQQPLFSDFPVPPPPPPVIPSAPVSGPVPHGVPTPTGGAISSTISLLILFTTFIVLYLV
jgi:hypothetical protein